MAPVYYPGDMSSQSGPDPGDLPEHVRHNRAYWDGMAKDWAEAGERSWRYDSPIWGIWGLPETELRMLPDVMAGMDAIELGCGTAYVSSWMARRGARVVGIDNSAQQLRTARRLMEEHQTPLTLLHGNAESLPCSNASFDFAISEYGAAIWCDPYQWIPEAYRVLRPGGELVFMGTHPLAQVCAASDGWTTDTRLHRPYFGLHMQDWRHVAVDPGGMEFNLTLSAWLKLFRETGFQVIDYQELQPPSGVTGKRFSTPAEWAHRWPSEQAWKLSKIPQAR